MQISTPNTLSLFIASDVSTTSSFYGACACKNWVLASGEMSRQRQRGIRPTLSAVVSGTLDRRAKRLQPLPSGIRLQPLISTYLLAPHCQMRYSSHAQNTPLKSSSTSLTMLPRPGEKLCMYSSTTAAKSPKNRI